MSRLMRTDISVFLLRVRNKVAGKGLVGGMKKSFLLCSLLVLLFSATVVSAASLMLEYDGGIHEYNDSIYTLSINGNKISTPLEPIVFNDRALVPVREVFEATGATVSYVDSTQEIIIAGDGIKMQMAIGNNIVKVNGADTKIPDGVVPMLIAKKGESSKTMVPVRFISEALGYTVGFNGSNIEITTTTNTQTAQLQSLYCNQSGNTVMISVVADCAVKSITNPILTSNGVLYVDIYNAKSSLPGKTAVNKGAVTAVRTGVHDDYTRIAIDVNDIKSYSMALSSDRKTVMISTVQKSTDTQQEKIVVIDAGHGGSDGGAGGDNDGTAINEKDINLAVAKKTRDILTANGVKVVMTREGDTYPELTERSALANSQNAAIFVSIHSNSAPTAPAANGVEVYYSTQNNGSGYGVTSQELADKILSAILTYTKANNRKVKTENHVVTRTSNMPATLVEIGFMTNADELKKLLDDDYQYKLASGIAEGILKCLPKITVPAGEAVQLGESNLGTKIA